MKLRLLTGKLLLGALGLATGVVVGGVAAYGTESAAILEVGNQLVELCDPGEIIYGTSFSYASDEEGKPMIGSSRLEELRLPNGAPLPDIKRPIAGTNSFMVPDPENDQRADIVYVIESAEGRFIIADAIYCDNDGAGLRQMRVESGIQP